MIKNFFLLLVLLLTVNISFAQTRREIVDACFRDICIEISKKNLFKDNKVLPEEIKTYKELQAFLTELYPDEKNPLRKCCKNLNYKSNTYKDEELPKYWNDVVAQFVVGVDFDNTKIQDIITKYNGKVPSVKEQVNPKINNVHSQESIETGKDEVKSLQSQIDELETKLLAAENEIKNLKTENDKLKKEVKKNSNQSPFSIPVKLILFLITIPILFFIYFKKDLIMAKKDLIMAKWKTLRKGKGASNSSSVSTALKGSEIEDKSQPSLPELTDKKIEANKFSFPTIKDKQWLIIKGKAIGKSHISKNQPCQDNHYFEQINKTWGIAVNCDGMGSGDISQIGSEKVSLSLVKFFKERIINEEWFLNNSLPSNDEWSKIAKEILKGTKAALSKYAIKENYNFQQLATTAIVVVYSPHGLLVTHIGDGRAGYCNDKGEWNSVMIPHKGEEANETTFITSNWDAEPTNSSGVSVPECRVIDAPIRAFTLMSDGCEQHFFETKIQDPNYQSKKLIEINRPYANTMNGLVGTFYEMLKDKIVEDEINNHFNKYVKEGTARIKNEPDDKSIIIGIFY
jgi:serine/threonine protein phosphatase PrpC/polyhydroxyalkanoate synthesis regulator phasin